MTDYKLINNENSRRYEFQIDGFIPKIEYILSENREIYLTHTEVPPALEGKGIASQLVLKVLQDIEHKNLRLVPLCPFCCRLYSKASGVEKVDYETIILKSAYKCLTKRIMILPVRCNWFHTL